MTLTPELADPSKLFNKNFILNAPSCLEQWEVCVKHGRIPPWIFSLLLHGPEDDSLEEHEKSFVTSLIKAGLTERQIREIVVGRITQCLVPLGFDFLDVIQIIQNATGFALWTMTDVVESMCDHLSTEFTVRLRDLDQRKEPE